MCGAGISHWAPSNKPLGDELKDFLRKSLAREITTDTRLQAQLMSESLSLEEFISKSGWGVESSLDRIFSKEGSLPNAWHRFIATLIKKGLLRCIFTVNFDRLIEKALEELSLDSPRDYSIIANERYEPANGEDPIDSDKPTLFYLHGTHNAWSMCVTVPHIVDP